MKSMKFRCGGCGKCYLVEHAERIDKRLSLRCIGCDNTFSLKPNGVFFSSDRNSELICSNCGSFADEGSKACLACKHVLDERSDATASDGSAVYEFCSSCGNLADGAGGKCLACNRASSSRREEMAIDNKEYEFFVVRNGRIRSKHGRKKTAWPMLFLAGGAAAAAALFWLELSGRHAVLTDLLRPATELLGTRTEMQVVIMRSGQTYYGEKVEHDGNVVRITDKNGIVTTVDEKDVQQIAQAVLEN